MNIQWRPLIRFWCIFASLAVMCAAPDAQVEELKAPASVPAQTQLPGRVQRGTTSPRAQPPATAQPAATKPVSRVPLLLRPDLVVSGFSVSRNAWKTEGMYATAPFWVTIRNAGNVQVPNPFYVTIQYATAGNPTWRGENDGNNCFRVTALLKPNQTYRFQGRLKVVSSLVSERMLKLRALADFTCLSEFPKPNGDVAESNESNNFSSEVILTGGYLPNLTSLKPEMCVKGSGDCCINGMSLGVQQGSHTVAVERGAQKTAVKIKSWADGQVHFTVPDGVEVGESQVYIAESGTLNKVSNALKLKVAETKTLEWNKLVTNWDLFKWAFSLRFHTWSGGSEYNNQSELVIFDTMKIDVPKVELKNWAGHYRFLFNDMKSKPSGIALSKSNCTPSQLRLNVVFESTGRELIGYYKVLGPAGQWRRAGAPDIQINNGRLSVLFSFYFYAGVLNYNANATFDASVRANNSAADALMDYFLSNWNDDVKTRIASGVRDGLMKPEIKTKIIDHLTGVIRQLLPLPKDRTIAGMEFTANAIKVTSY